MLYSMRYITGITLGRDSHYFKFVQFHSFYSYLNGNLLFEVGISMPLCEMAGCFNEVEINRFLRRIYWILWSRNDRIFLKWKLVFEMKFPDRRLNEANLNSWAFMHLCANKIVHSILSREIMWFFELQFLPHDFPVISYYYDTKMDSMCIALWHVKVAISCFFL